MLVLQKTRDSNMHERPSVTCMLFSNGGILKIYSAHTNEKGIMSEVHTIIYIYVNTPAYKLQVSYGCGLYKNRDENTHDRS